MIKKLLLLSVIILSIASICHAGFETEKLGITEGGADPTFHTYMQGGDQGGDVTYTLPAVTGNGFLKNTAGVWTWEEGASVGNVLRVNANTAYATIALAMTAASSGDTILVEEGTYDEAVVFTQDNITLKAHGSAKNTIITQAAGTTVDFSTKSGCVLDGFTVALTAATSTNDEVIYSGNDDAADYNIIQNCIITCQNNVANTFGMYMLRFGDGNTKVLNNDMTITQTNSQASYATIDAIAHTTYYENNTLTMNHTPTAAQAGWGLCSQGNTAYFLNNKIVFTSNFTAAGTFYVIYAAAGNNYINGNEIIATTSSTGMIYGLYVGGTDTGYFTGNNVCITTGDSDGQWAHIGATATGYLNGNVVSGDGVLGTGGTIYGGANLINGNILLGTIEYTLPNDNGDAGEQLQTNGSGALTWEAKEVITAGDGLTRTTDDIDFDGGDAPGGELGGTWASPTIDDSLAVTSWNLTTPTLTTSATVSDAGWIGLASNKGRIQFDDETVDTIGILDAELNGDPFSDQQTNIVAGMSLGVLTDCRLLLGFTNIGDNTTETDLSGAGHTVTYADASNWTTGDQLHKGFIWSADFDGSDDYITVNDAADLTFSAVAFSMGSWIEVVAGVTEQTVIAKFDTNLGGIEYLLRLTSSETILMYFYDNSAAKSIYTTSDTPLSAGWHFVAATYDGGTSATGINIYIDGKVVASTDTSEAGYVSMDDTGAPVYLGAIYSGAFTNYFTGDMALPFIRGGVLTAAEVWELYMKQKGFLNL